MATEADSPHPTVQKRKPDRSKITIEYITASAERHFQTLFKGLHQTSQQKSCFAGYFVEPMSPYVRRVFLSCLQTYFGNTEDFWHPLFMDIVGRDPVLPGTEKLSGLHDFYWDRIYPLGAQALEIVRSNHEELTASTAGEYTYPLPLLYEYMKSIKASLQ